MSSNNGASSSSQPLDTQSSGISIRENAPVIQQWPWENGLPLQHGSMESSLRSSLDGTGQEPDFVTMVLVGFQLFKTIIT